MYGGGFATIPAFLADIFGPDNVGAIHGALLTAWSAAAVAGPVIITELSNRAKAALAPGGRSHSHLRHAAAGAGRAARSRIRPDAAGPPAAGSPAVGASAFLASLFDRRLLAFSGKGGAGKSTATAAFAVAAARAGKRVLVVEIGEHERISRLFGAPPVGYGGGIVYRPGAAGAPPVTAMCITASEALREYGMRTVRFETLYNAVFDNPVVRYLSAAAPAVQELNILGKIESLHRESIDPAPGARFDLMLLDAPATGHAVALFESPRLAMRLAQAGPIHAMVERVWRLVTDPARTALNIVSLPQDVVVNESLEFAARIGALGIPPGWSSSTASTLTRFRRTTSTAQLPGPPSATHRWPTRSWTRHDRSRCAAVSRNR